MYNHVMPDNSYEIRKCTACGLRYPLIVGHPVGIRCPLCLGETSIVLRVSRGLVAESPPRVTGRKSRPQRAVILDNIRSAWNVGSIFRSADGFGFTHVYLCGITPTPDHEAVMKTSLGAQDSVPWSYHRDALMLAKSLKKESFQILGLEEDIRAEELVQATKSSADSVLIVGNEVTGVDPELLELCDEILYIPMHGEKKSFNVAVAFGIAAYALTAG